MTKQFMFALSPHYPENERETKRFTPSCITYKNARSQTKVLETRSLSSVSIKVLERNSTRALNPNQLLPAKFLCFPEEYDHFHREVQSKSFAMDDLQ